MKFNSAFIVLLALLLSAALSVAQETSVDQIKQMMTNSAENLTTYTYSRSAESGISYSNESIKKTFEAVKVTQGKVNLTEPSGWWSAQLTDKSSGQVLIWEGYFVNGSEYWKENQNWTRFMINDSAKIMEEYNEIPGQVNLINYSNMKVVGSENCDGGECYKLMGTPIEPIYKGLIGLQLLAAYFPSPLALPGELRNRSFDIDNTDLVNNSNITLTAWVSKDKSLLKRLDINSSLVITPKILNITAPNFRIESIMNESTVYNNFGSPVKIELPMEALKNESYRTTGTDWRWAAFGSVRP